MALLWAVVASTYEKAVGDDYPLVIHTFLGKTPDEAVGILQAHMRADAFLRGCTEQQKFKSVDCRTDTVLLRYDTVTKKFIEP
jgi:hypothetical protein